MSDPIEYFRPIAGGYFGHCSGDCSIHGDNVAFWHLHERHKERKDRTKFCVECTLEAQKLLGY